MPGTIEIILGERGRRTEYLESFRGTDIELPLAPWSVRPKRRAIVSLRVLAGGLADF